MSSLSASQLLEVWARGRMADAPERALALLACAYPQTPVEDLRGWPLGRRDAELLRLRGATFGERIVAVVDCPDCGETLELELAVRSFLDEARPEPPHELHVEHDGYDVTFRVPDSEDLRCALDGSGACDTGGAAELEARIAHVRSHLLERCVRSARRGDQHVAARELPDGVVAFLEDVMASADPGADVRLQLLCPECEHGWQPSFDVTEFLWREVEQRAEGLLDEVHVFASAYGWSEREVLALPAARRRAYLRRLQS